MLMCGNYIKSICKADGPPPFRPRDPPSTINNIVTLLRKAHVDALRAARTPLLAGQRRRSGFFATCHDRNEIACSTLTRRRLHLHFTRRPLSTYMVVRHCGPSTCRDDGRLFFCSRSGNRFNAKQARCVSCFAGRREALHRRPGQLVLARYVTTLPFREPRPRFLQTPRI